MPALVPDRLQRTLGGHALQGGGFFYLRALHLRPAAFLSLYIFFALEFNDLALARHNRLPHLHVLSKGEQKKRMTSRASFSSPAVSE
jgi:hypothetical protein